uniref:Uncharacterized protein n=1 Tax=Cacopsylla melanoneura TaxID=428564 RepID=A0A8D9AMB9_9HEMI
MPPFLRPRRVHRQSSRNSRPHPTEATVASFSSKDTSGHSDGKYRANSRNSSDTRRIDCHSNCRDDGIDSCSRTSSKNCDTSLSCSKKSCSNTWSSYSKTWTGHSSTWTDRPQSSSRFDHI